MSRPGARPSSAAVGCQKALQQDLRRRMPRSRRGSMNSMPLPASRCARVRKTRDDGEGEAGLVEVC